MTDAENLRWLPIEGCVNFRDLGGYGNQRRGRTVRWRRLFRSDALQDMTSDDALFAINELGIRTWWSTCGTRTRRSATDAVRCLVRGAEYRHIPLLEERGFPPFTGQDVVERLSTTYQWLVHNSGARVAAAVNAIAEAEGGVVFHCSAGKDRTGLMAAMLLEVLGVDAETIEADYLLTNEAVEGILRRIQAMQPHASPTTQSLAAQPLALQRFRDTLQQEYGGAEAYLLGHGVEAEALSTLRRNLLE